MQTKIKEKRYLPPNLERVQTGNTQKNLQKYKQKISYPLYAGTAALATYTVILLILNFAAGVSVPILALIFADIAWLAEVLFVVLYQMLQWPSDLLTVKKRRKKNTGHPDHLLPAGGGSDCCIGLIFLCRQKSSMLDINIQRGKIYAKRKRTISGR